MNRSQQLWDLQLLDLEIDARHERIAEIDALLGESEALVQARAAYADARAHEEGLGKRQRTLDTEVQDYAAKIEPLETRLYSGTVRIPKELDALRQEVELMTAHKSQLEDQELDLMMEMEEVQAAAAAAQREMAAIETDWHAQQEQLAAERSAAESQLANLQQRRAAAAATVPAAYLELYETLRPQRRGRAVARVERNACSGCRVQLASTELQRLRQSPNPLQCSNCGRILYLG